MTDSLPRKESEVVKYFLEKELELLSASDAEHNVLLADVPFIVREAIREIDQSTVDHEEAIDFLQKTAEILSTSPFTFPLAHLVHRAVANKVLTEHLELITSPDLNVGTELESILDEQIESIVLTPEERKSLKQDRQFIINWISIKLNDEISGEQMHDLAEFALQSKGFHLAIVRSVIQDYLERKRVIFPRELVSEIRRNIIGVNAEFSFENGVFTEGIFPAIEIPNFNGFYDLEQFKSRVEFQGINAFKKPDEINELDDFTLRLVDELLKFINLGREIPLENKDLGKPNGGQRPSLFFQQILRVKNRILPLRDRNIEYEHRPLSNIKYRLFQLQLMN